MSIPPVLRSLLTATGPSGYETAPAAVWRDAASAWADEVRVDHMGSSTARVKGTAGGRTLAIVGHIDEIGLIVTHIDEKGFLRFIGVGGWDPVNLIGQRVEVTTKNGVIMGVIGKKPIHLMKPDERKAAAEMKDLHIDIGADGEDEAKAAVRIGDVAVIAGEPVELPNDRVVSRSMDNRLGCYVAFEAARLVKEAGGAKGDVIAVAGVQEETGLSGAATLAHNVDIDLAIVTDVTHATDAPGIDVNEIGAHAFGSGPVIERGVALSPVVSELLLATADTDGIPYTIAASARHTGTDVDALHISRGGVPCGLVSLPLRYMHSPVEMMQLDDIENAAKLIAAFALSLAADQTFLR